MQRNAEFLYTANGALPVALFPSLHADCLATFRASAHRRTGNARRAQKTAGGAPRPGRTQGLGGRHPEREPTARHAALAGGQRQLGHRKHRHHPRRTLQRRTPTGRLARGQGGTALRGGPAHGHGAGPAARVFEHQPHRPHPGGAQARPRGLPEAARHRPEESAGRGGVPPPRRTRP